MRISFSFAQPRNLSCDHRFTGLLLEGFTLVMKYGPFKNMAFKGREIVDRVVKEKMGGEINLEKDIWIIPDD